MKARAGEFYFVFLTISEIAIQQQGESSVECNLFMGMAWNRRRVILPCDVGVREKPEQRADNRNDKGCDRTGKRMENCFFSPPTSHLRKMSVISGAAAETF